MIGSPLQHCEQFDRGLAGAAGIMSAEITVMTQGSLTKLGYEVVSAENGRVPWEQLNASIR
jgi:hypothetical protein